MSAVTKADNNRGENKFVIRPLKEGEVSSFNLHGLAHKARELEDLVPILEALGVELQKFKKNDKNYYKSLSQFLKFRYLEFQYDHRSFVIAHYFFILDHIFAPARYAPEMSDLESILTINRSLVHGLFPPELRQKVGDIPFLWMPFIREIIRGLEYLSTLFSINLKLGSAKRFHHLISSCSDLTAEEIEALWQFRCGLVHAGTLYNISAKGTIYRFRVGVFSGEKVIFTPDDVLEFLDGNRYLIDLPAFYNIYEESQEYVYNHMRDDFHKYILSDNYHDWVRTHWSVSYLPRKDEMDKSEISSSLPSIDINDIPQDKTGHAQIVFFEND